MATGQAPGFAALLRRYRRAAGLTQEALAEQAHLSVYTVSALERGANQTPRKDTVALLAEALGLTPRERAALEAAARGLGAAPEAPCAASDVVAPLVGRTRELALLDRHLAGDGPPVVLLAGEPGIGKTRLLHEVQARGRAGGWTVLAGGCQRRGGQDPYAPLTGALEQRLRRATATQARTELAGCAWLARLLPEVVEMGAEPLPAWTLTPGQERRLLVRSVERYLRNVAGPAGTLLVLDDLQWAGPDTLDVLAALVASAEDIPLRVLGAYRSTEVQPSDPLAVLLADLVSAGHAIHCALGPLPAEEAQDLLDRLLAGQSATPAEAAGRAWPDATVCARVLQRAGGVPFFLVSCAQSLRAEGPDATPLDEDVPGDLAQSIRQRVAALPPAAQEVLRTAAVVGRVAERALLLSMTARCHDDVLDALDMACQARLLEEEGQTAYRFAHDVVREVVEGDLSTARRAALHQRVAEVLEALPGAPAVEVLAYHYAHSDATDKAVVYLEHAGDRAAARSAHTAAERYYRDLVRRLEALGRHHEAAPAYATLGLLLARTARHDEAIAALQRVAEVYGVRGGTDPLEQTTPTGGIRNTHHPPHAAVARIQAILALIEEHAPEHTRGRLYLAHATLAQFQNRFQDCLAAADRAAALAQRQGDTTLLAQALLQRGGACGHLGQRDVALAALQEARRLCETEGNLGLLSEVLQELVIAHEMRGELAQSNLYNAQSLKIAEEVGDSWTAALAVFRRTGLAFDSGDWGCAEANLALAVQIAPHLAHDPYVACLQSLLSLGRGAWADASARLGEAVNRAAHMGNMQALVWAERLLAELDLLQGHPATALARLQALLDREAVHDVAFMLPYVALAHLQLSEVDEAEAVAAQAVARATAEDNCIALADALRVRAQVAIEQQRWVEAQRALAEGLTLTRRVPYPYAEARLLHVYGLMHARRGEPEAARERLREALAIFRRLGARKDVERAERVLTSLV